MKRTIVFNVYICIGIYFLLLYAVSAYLYRHLRNGYKSNYLNDLQDYTHKTSNKVINTVSGASIITRSGIMNALSTELLKFPQLASQFQPRSKNPCVYIQTNQTRTKLQKHSNRFFDMHHPHKRTELRCLPYFLLIGFSKCGTSDIWKRLTQHPEISGPSCKEPHYWDMWKSSKRNLHYYTARYKDISNKVESCLRMGPSSHCTSISGDFSPSTVWSTANWRIDSANSGLEEPTVLVPHQLKHLLPDAKLIVILRDPTERLFSSYKFFAGVKHGFNVSADHFDQYAKEAVTCWDTCIKQTGERMCAIDKTHMDMSTGWMKVMAEQGYNPLSRFTNSLYYFYIREWLQVFPKSQLLTLKFEEYTVDHLSTLQKISHFLNISSYSRTLQVDHIENKNNMHEFNMHIATKSMLKQFFDSFNQRLAKLLNDDRFLW